METDCGKGIEEGRESMIEFQMHEKKVDSRTGLVVKFEGSKGANRGIMKAKVRRV